MKPLNYRLKLVRLANRTAQLLGADTAPGLQFDRNSLLGLARKRTGLDDFGDDAFLEPLDRLLDALQSEARLNFIGRLALREDVVHTLSARLKIEAAFKQSPEHADVAIRAPIFVTGLPRSGTTLMHNLLAQDPAHRFASGWEVMYPVPAPGDSPDQNDPRVGRAQKRMQQLYWLAPDFKVIHPLDASQPQECISIMAHAFMSDVFPTTCHVPAYQRWLDDIDMQPAYQYHRRFLQYLQAGTGGVQWVLKAPAHLFSLAALLEAYPDARIVMMHRDPAQVLPSLANLTRVLRRAFSDEVEPAQIGREELDRWSSAIDRALSVLACRRDRSANVLHIQYEDLASRPMETLDRLYAGIGLELSDTARQAMQSFLLQNPKNKYGRHRYTLEQFGLQEQRIRDRFATYQEQFFNRY